MNSTTDRRRARPRPRRPPVPETPLAALPGEAPLGAHISTAGGTPTAPARAAAIGATAMQIFTKTPNQWAERLCSDAERAAFAEGRRAAGLRVANAHDSYLINLASPDGALRVRSLLSFINELKRCGQLGLEFLVSHPGNYMDERFGGLARNAECIVAALEIVAGETMLLLETTAGSGTALGASFEEIGALIELIPEPQRRRVGVCVDTAHVFAAGYDLVRDYDGVWAHFDDAIGLRRLRMMHLNDSKAPLASRRDRHELIGEGTIGAGPFRRVMTDPRFAHVPKVIETPKGDDPIANDTRMLNRLRRYAREG
jgi:deoxyribonuclease IV